MVAVVHAAPGSAARSLDAIAAAYPRADAERFREVLDSVVARAGDARSADGEPLVERALGIAGIVAGLRLDPASILSTAVAS